MHEISAEVEEVTTTPEPTEDEPDPEPVTEYILHITVSRDVYKRQALPDLRSICVLVIAPVWSIKSSDKMGLRCV